MSDPIDKSVFAILEEIPSELLSSEETQRYVEVLQSINIGHKEIDDLREEQVDLTRTVVNLAFAVANRVRVLKSEYAPIKSKIIEEVQAASKHKLTNEMREQLVAGHPSSAIYIDAISIGELLLDQLSGIRKTLDYRYQMVYEKSVEARHDRKVG